MVELTQNVRGIAEKGVKQWTRWSGKNKNIYFELGVFYYEEFMQESSDSLLKKNVFPDTAYIYFLFIIVLEK